MLKPREQLLHDFIESSKNEPAVWGQSDCTMWAAHWVEVALGRKVPAIPYNRRSEAYKIIKQKGGLVRIWDEALNAVGIYSTEFPELGDVAICNTNAYGEVGLVFAHGGIAYWRATEGVLALSPRTIVKAWKVT